MAEHQRIDAVDYDNGQKNNWRRMVWNRIAEHATNRYDSVILYLPGENNYDYHEAVARNFKPHCLVAVERDRRIVSNLRDAGQLTIHSDLWSVMKSWPARVPVAAVIADLQCPLGPYPVRVVGAWSLFAAFNKSLLVLNLQRGREHASAKPLLEDMKQILDGDKHRVHQVMYQHCMSTACSSRENEVEMLGHCAKVEISDKAEAARVMAWMVGSYRITRSGSYRSSDRAPLMDWGIVKHSSIANAFYKHSPGPDRPLADEDTTRQVAAVLAHRTMRMRKLN